VLSVIIIGVTFLLLLQSVILLNVVMLRVMAPFLFTLAS
jgi:hypothetical protein